MSIATGVVLGILIIGIGAAFSSLLGFFLIGLGRALVQPIKVKPFTGFIAGVLAVIGLLLLTAGPLASLWGGIATFVHFLGV